jgi:hypothetical protein
VPQPLNRLCFDLPHPLTGEIHPRPDLLKGLSPCSSDPKAPLDDVPLKLTELKKRTNQILLGSCS